MTWRDLLVKIGKRHEGVSSLVILGINIRLASTGFYFHLCHLSGLTEGHMNVILL